MASRPNFWQRFLHKNTPSREEVLSSRWLKPFGHRVAHSELWRFTRRSVPRAVFAGLFIGIFLMVPGLQIVGAALLCVPMRGNIPIAAAMTFLPARNWPLLTGMEMINAGLLPPPSREAPCPLAGWLKLTKLPGAPAKPLREISRPLR